MDEYLKPKNIPYQWPVPLLALLIITCNSIYLLSVLTNWIPQDSRNYLLNIFAIINALSSSVLILWFILCGKSTSGSSPSTLKTDAPDETDQYIETFNLNILNALSAQIAALDAQGNIIATNKAWTTFGKENSVLQASLNIPGSKCPDNSNYKEQALAAQQGISSVLKGEQAEFCLEYPCHTTDQQHWFQMTVSPIQNSIIGVIINHQCITEHKLLQASAAGLLEHIKTKDLEHLKQLAHFSRLGLMSELASGIVHEVNQPLSAISNYSQASANYIKAENPDLAKLAELVNKTREQALRAGQIIQRMREFIKSQATSHLSNDVNTLINSATFLCLANLTQHNIQLILNLENNLPPITVDHIQIEQVIINLIKNSTDAIVNSCQETKRQITINSRLTYNNMIEISIKDNGPGLTQEQHKKILTPYYTTKEDGMGIGLSISKSIIESHQGSLHFNSQPGQGATFYITLPISDQES